MNSNSRGKRIVCCVSFLLRNACARSVWNPILKESNPCVDGIISDCSPLFKEIGFRCSVLKWSVHLEHSVETVFFHVRTNQVDTSCEDNLGGLLVRYEMTVFGQSCARMSFDHAGRFEVSRSSGHGRGWACTPICLSF